MKLQLSNAYLVAVIGLTILNTCTSFQLTKGSHKLASSSQLIKNKKSLLKMSIIHPNNIICTCGICSEFCSPVSLQSMSSFMIHPDQQSFLNSNSLLLSADTAVSGEIKIKIKLKYLLKLNHVNCIMYI